jgi:mercuric ion transport protein
MDTAEFGIDGTMKIFERHADKLGTGGSLFAALCCLGTPAILSFLAAIGAGFLVNDLILLPLLAITLAIAGWGLAEGRKVHRNPKPLSLGVMGIMLIPVGIFTGGWLVTPGAVLLIGATVWNVVARRHCEAAARTLEGVAPAAGRGALTPSMNPKPGGEP